MKSTVAARYDDLALRREPYLRRARKCAEVTIPSLLPPEGYSGTNELPQPYQGLGSRCITYLNSRLMTALLPVGQTFFILEPPIELLIEQGEMDADEETERQLAMAEQLVMSEVERRNWRRPTTDTLYQLILSGNGCEYFAPDNSIKSFRFDSFVVNRNLMDEVTEVIVKQGVYPDGIPNRYLDPKSKKGQMVDLYTYSRRTSRGWITVQELNGQPYGERRVSLRCPFMVYRWTAIPGEPYGRGKIEEHYPDLIALEGYTKAMLDIAGMNARNLVLVRPNATGNQLRKFIEKADNGAVGVGNVEDVNMIRFENIPGAQIIGAEIERLTREIATAFLIGSGVRRDADRVTATEIRAVAEELEGVLGGVYSMLSEDMQRERLSRLIENMETQQRLPEGISAFVDMQITVGLEALRRERDAMRVQQVLTLLPGLPQEALDYVPWDDLLKKLFIGAGLPGDLRSEEEVAQIRENRMLQQAISQLGPDQLASLGLSPQAQG